MSQDLGLADLPVQRGELFLGKYLIGETLGAGGMGVVVAAEHVQLGQKVAVKFLSVELRRNADAVSRFLREARAAARIRSEHVVRVVDVDGATGDVCYMVMEILEGEDLARVIRLRGRLSPADAVGYILQACEAIAEAHDLGIVHRDLKPSNLFITHRRDGSPLLKVLDFGISKTVAAGAGGVDEGRGRMTDLTSSRMVLGSPMYMSPEQVRSAKSVDARTDVWALGVILHELLTGQPAFNGESTMEVLAKIVVDPPARLRESRPELPVELERIVLACLEKAAATRLQSVAALAQRLAPFAPSWAMATIARIVGTGPPVEARSDELGTRVGSTQPMPVAITTSAQLSGEMLPNRPTPSRSGRAAGRADSGGVTARRSSGGRVVWASLLAVAVVVIAALALRGSSHAPSTVGPLEPGEPVARQRSSSSSAPQVAKVPTLEVAVPPSVHEAAPTERERAPEAESAVKPKAKLKHEASPASASTRPVDAARSGAKKRTVAASTPSDDMAPAAVPPRSSSPVSAAAVSSARKDPLDGRR